LTSPNADKKTGRRERCPICAKETVADYAPFCSKRCADIDLHRWFSGSYAIPAVEDDDEAEETLDEQSGDE